MKKLVTPLFLLFSALASAGQMDYHFSGVVSGTVGRTTLNGALLDIHLIGDTNNIVSGGGVSLLYADPGQATISISDVGTGTFTKTVMVFDNQDSNKIGFTAHNPILFNDIIQISGNTIGTTFFKTYDLTTETGPWVGTVNLSLVAWQNVETTLGDISLTSMLSPTFEAKVAAVPEPASLLVLGTGVAALLRRRRR